MLHDRDMAGVSWGDNHLAGRWAVAPRIPFIEPPHVCIFIQWLFFKSKRDLLWTAWAIVTDLRDYHEFNIRLAARPSISFKDA